MAARQKGTKTGPCLVNRDGKPHYKQETRNRPRKTAGRKCIRKLSIIGEPQYKRLKTAMADKKVSEEGWKFCSKGGCREAQAC